MAALPVPLGSDVIGSIVGSGPACGSSNLSFPAFLCQ